MTGIEEFPVRTLDPSEVRDVVAVLCDSFRDYPVMRYVVGDHADYDARLDRLVTLFTLTRVLRRQPVLGVGPQGALVGVALLSYPGASTDAPPDLEEARERTWAALGADARARYATFVEVSAPFHVEEGHHYLGMIGVRSDRQGQGVGRRLLDAVHGLSAADPASIGVALSTEVEANVGLYRHFGYEVIGSAPVETAFTTWSMLRRDPSG